MRVLSVDYDGVVHGGPGRGPRDFRYGRWLHGLLARYDDLHIIVHSTWRFMCDDSELERVLHATGDVSVNGLPIDGPPYNFANVPASVEHHLRFLGATPREVMGRWESIDAWLKTQPEPYAIDYRILDDEPDKFPRYIRDADVRRLIRCSPETGCDPGSNSFHILMKWLDNPQET